MENYFDTLNVEIKEYFKILSPEFPEWLLEYIIRNKHFQDCFTI